MSKISLGRPNWTRHKVPLVVPEDTATTTVLPLSALQGSLYRPSLSIQNRSATAPWECSPPVAPHRRSLPSSCATSPSFNNRLQPFDYSRHCPTDRIASSCSRHPLPSNHRFESCMNGGSQAAHSTRLQADDNLYPSHTGQQSESELRFCACSALDLRSGPGHRFRIDSSWSHSCVLQSESSTPIHGHEIDRDITIWETWRWILFRDLTIPDCDLLHEV